MSEPAQPDIHTLATEIRDVATRIEDEESIPPARYRALWGELLAWLPRGDSKEEAQSEWDAALDSLASAVVTGMEGPFSQKIQRVRLLDPFIDTAWTVDDHPRVFRQSKRKVADSEHFESPVDLELTARMTRRCLLEASSAERVQLFEKLSDWTLAQAIAKSVLHVHLGADEVATLLASAWRMGRGDLAASSLLDPLQEWFREHPKSGRDLVDSWAARRNGNDQELPTGAIQIVVEAIVLRSPDESWRRSLIDRLSRDINVERRQLAARLICFAWPEENAPPLEERFRLLLEYARKAPEELFGSVLLALARGLRQAPNAALQVLREFLDELETPLEVVASSNYDGTVPGSVYLAALAGPLSWWLRDNATLWNDVAPSLSWYLLGPLSFTGPNHCLELDGLLTQVNLRDPELVESFLTSWLEHQDPSSENLAGLDSLFPSLARMLTPAGVASLLIHWLVHRNERVREASRLLWWNTRELHVTEHAFTSLDAFQVRALAPAGYGWGLPPEKIVPALFICGRSRLEALDEILSSLLTDFVHEVPGAVRRFLGDWANPPTSMKETDRQRLQQAAAGILSALDQRAQAIDQALKIPDVREVHPFAEESTRLFHLSYRRAMKAAESDGRSFIAQISQKVSLARGRRSLLGGPDRGATELSTLEHQTELPSREIVNPLWAQVRRHYSRVRSKELLSEASINQGEP